MVIDRQLINEVSLTLGPLVNARDQEIVLQYYLVEGLYKDNQALNDKHQTFGVEVLKKEYLNKKPVITEREMANHLVLRKELAVEIIGKLSRNSVPPSTLYEILDDMIGIEY